MPTPDQEIVYQVLEAHDRGASVYRAIAHGWDLLLERHPERARWRRKTTRAALVWEYAVDNLIQSIDGAPGVQIVPHHDTISFIFDDLVLLRLKKADIELRTRNYPTTLAQLFHDHRADLFGRRGLHRVEAAYGLNRFETRPDWIGIVARQKRRVLWNFELGSRGAVVRQLPLTPQAQPGAARIVQLSRGQKSDLSETSE